MPTRGTPPSRYDLWADAGLLSLYPLPRNVTADKTSQSEVVDQLIMRRSDKFTTCVAHTTREQREGEIPGLDYEYVSDEQFETLKKSNYFAEFLQSGKTRSKF